LFLHRGHPPSALTALSPGEPWVPVPDRMMQMARSLLIRCQRAQEGVDGGLAGTPVWGRAQLDDAFMQGQVMVGRDDVDMVGFEALTVLGSPPPAWWRACPAAGPSGFRAWGRGGG
jgi:hypothetical protein